MSNEGSYSTEQQMMQDFNDAAHSVLCASFERGMQHKLPPDFEDKPLSALYVRFDAVHPATDANLRSTEKLTSYFLTETDFECELDKPLIAARIPEATRPFYIAAIQKVGALSLTDELVIRRNVPVEAVEFKWSGGSHRRKRQIGTFKTVPRQSHLIAALDFIDQVREYISSDIFDAPESIRYLHGAIDRHGINHRFGISYSDDLPLNGHESTEFLTGYIAVMSQRLMAKRITLSRYESEGLPVDRIKQQEGSVKQLELYLERAETLLGQRD